jgi:hypothetical protein
LFRPVKIHTLPNVMASGNVTRAPVKLKDEIAEHKCTGRR